MSFLANIALAEFQQRKASIDAAVRVNRFDRDEGERLLACWLSIALAAGARPGECSTLLADWQREKGLGDAQARSMLLALGPDRADWTAELTRARDAAAKKARAHPTDDQLGARHHNLDSLCIYLGCVSEPQTTAEFEREAA